MVGRQIQQYQLLEKKLGAGSMGEIYKALDTRLNRTVAIKVLPSCEIRRPRSPSAVSYKKRKPHPA